MEGINMNFYVRCMFICWLALANILNLTHNGSQGNILPRDEEVEIKSTGNCYTEDKKYSPIDDIIGQGRTVEESAKACQARCFSVSGCAYFSFWNDGGCHLSSSAATLQSANGVTGGFKSCSEKCLTSPGYPGKYPNNFEKRETLRVEADQSIEISFVAFNVEGQATCAYDSLYFQDGNGNIIGKKLCGDSLPEKVIIPTSIGYAVFKTDVSVTKKGYKFCYKSQQMQCGIENFGRGSRISGGRETQPNQYPWMVRLQMKRRIDGRIGGCGGALITDRHVLTAYHCVDDYDSQGNFVEINVKESSVKYSVHNQYRDFQQVLIKKRDWPSGAGRIHDIAILVLAAPVNLNDKTVGTVCLPANSREDYRGETATAMGWGRTGFGPGGGSSRFLKHVDLTVSQQQAKNWLFTEVRKDINGVPQDPCAGDSGGPLVHKDARTRRWTIIGTVQGQGYDCRTGKTNGEGQWNKVTDHLAWIKLYIKNNN